MSLVENAHRRLQGRTDETKLVETVATALENPDEILCLTVVASDEILDGKERQFVG